MGLMGIFYCLYFLDSSYLEGHIPVFNSPRNRVAHLYPRAWAQVTDKVTLRLTVSQSILMSSPFWFS
jgi:hypothetical protein